MSMLVLALGWAGVAALLYDWLIRPEAAPTLPRLRLAPMADWLRRAGVREITPWQFLAVSAGLALAAGLAVQLWQGFLALSVVGAAVAGLAPTSYFRVQERRRQAELEEALAEAMRQLRDAVRGGLALSEAFEGLARTGPLRLRREFDRLTRQATYDGLAPALASLRDRLASPRGDQLIAALLLNDRLGGRQLSTVLDRLARSARDQRRLRREAEAAQAGQRLAVTIAALIPALVFVAIHRASPGYLAFFATGPGEVLLFACALALTLAYAAMLHLGRMPAEPRVLRPEERKEPST